MAQINKQRLSVSVSIKTLELLDDYLKLEKFRNKSHAVEFSINKVLKKKNFGKEKEKGETQNA